MQGDESRPNRTWAIMLCLVISVLLHLLTAWVLIMLPKPDKKPFRQQGSGHPVARLVQVTRTAQNQETEEVTKELPFAKTNPDQPEKQPETVDFEGKRNTQASAGEDAPKRIGPDPLPTQNGEERDEINTLEQERQDGPLEHDGKKRSPNDFSPQSQENQANDATETPPAQGKPDGVSSASPSQSGQDRDREQPSTATVLPIPSQMDGDMKLTPITLQQEPEDFSIPSPPPGSEQGIGKEPAAPLRRQAAYDPSLADHAQPGFRTYERKSRSTGRFILGRHASLNVAATPRGKYEEQIYRRIAYYWYMACDEHRGDIIPGSITIAIRINKRGGIANMDLMNRRGASVIQQSFTFGAIRKASLPPMPDDVQRDLIGDLLELIFTFNFD